MGFDQAVSNGLSQAAQATAGISQGVLVTVAVIVVIFVLVIIIPGIAILCRK